MQASPHLKPLRIGIAGLGTVGVGVVKVLQSNAALIAKRAQCSIIVTAVSSRDKTRDRGVDLANIAWLDNAADLATHDAVDVVVELIGGSEGVALSLAQASLEQGKAFVTANKAMIAHHGHALAATAEAKGLPLKYEAAVAGGIPVIKGLREGAAANEITSVFGILNGTCNYILTVMESEGRDFAAVLADAQKLGYAEADPSFDVDGVDAAHKLSILASIAFGTQLNFDAVQTAGIRAVGAVDIAQARTLGYCVRLVGIAEMTAQGLYQAVQPCLVPFDHALAHVTGAKNAVVAQGDFVGQLLFEGRGAGEGPTASAVVADLIDIARGESGAVFGMPVAALTAATVAAHGQRICRHYLRFSVADKRGVLAELTAAMRDAGVSIESLIQSGATPDGAVLLVMTTHEGPECAVTDALARLERSDSVLTKPVVMQILT